MKVAPNPPALLIRVPVEEPIGFEFEQCRTIRDKERVVLWARSVPELADLISRAVKIHKAGRNGQ